MDRWHTFLQQIKAPDWLTTLLDHNRWSVIGVVLATVLLLTVQGCDLMKVVSPVDGKQVSRTELADQQQTWETSYAARVQALQTEGQQMSQRFKAADAQIQQRVSSLNGLLNLVSGYIPDGPWKAALPLALAFVATGLKVDNSRKDSVITAQSVLPAVVTTVKPPAV